MRVLVRYSLALVVAIAVLAACIAVLWIAYDYLGDDFFLPAVLILAFLVVPTCGVVLRETAELLDDILPSPERNAAQRRELIKQHEEEAAELLATLEAKYTARQADEGGSEAAQAERERLESEIKTLRTAQESIEYSTKPAEDRGSALANLEKQLVVLQQALADLNGANSEPAPQPNEQLPTQRDLLNEAIARLPENAALRVQRARYYIFDLKAEPDVEKALQLIPGYPKAFTVRGMARKHNEDIDGAKHDFREAIRLDPKAIEPRHKLASIYNNRGEHGKAKELVESFSHNHSALAQLAEAQKGLGNVSEAVKHYSELIDRKEWLYYFHCRAMMLYKQGNDELAARDLRQWLNIEASHRHSHTGHCLQMYDDAIACAEKILDSDLKSQLYHEAAARAERCGEYKPAIAYTKKLLPYYCDENQWPQAWNVTDQNQRPVATMMARWMRCLKVDGQLEEAISTGLNAADKWEQHADYFLGLIVPYIMQLREDGQIKQATAWLDSAMEQFGDRIKKMCLRELTEIHVTWRDTEHYDLDKAKACAKTAWLDSDRNEGLAATFWAICEAIEEGSGQAALADHYDAETYQEIEQQGRIEQERLALTSA